MTAVASLLVIIALSFFVVRLGTIALVMTGLSEEVARFQSLSAFSGAGYTTSESENVVKETARRRVIMFLIRAGSVGAVSTIATAVLTFIAPAEQGWQPFVLLVVGCIAIILLARSDRLNRWATPIIRRGLQRFTTLELRDYAGLLRLHEDWQISILEVGADTWLADRSLQELELDDEGVTILGIERNGKKFRGAPSGDTTLNAGDRLIVYGRAERLEELHDRDASNQAAHNQAKAEHKQKQSQEREEDDSASNADV